MGWLVRLRLFVPVRFILPNLLCQSVMQEDPGTCRRNRAGYMFNAEAS